MSGQKYHVLSRVKHFVFADTGPSAAYLEAFRFNRISYSCEPGLQFELICQCETEAHAQLVAGSLNQLDSIQRKIDDGALSSFNMQPCPVCDISPCVCTPLSRAGKYLWRDLDLVLMPRGISLPQISIARHAFLCDTCKKSFCTCAPFAMDPVPEPCKGCDIPFCACNDGKPDPNEVACKGLSNGCVCDNCVPF